MGTIPRKLKKINGFVKCKYGILPFENRDDEIKLKAYAQIFDKAVKEGRLILREGFPTPENNGSTKSELMAAKVIFSHAVKNIDEAHKIMLERERLGYD